MAYNFVTTEEKCSEGRGMRKHYSPFRCKWIPTSELDYFVDTYPKLCEFAFWTCFANWIWEGHIMMSRYRYYRHGNAINKRWQQHPMQKQLQEIMQRRFNYEKSTVSTGHILTRFGRIYRKQMNYSWRTQDDGTTKFYKGDLEVFPILSKIKP